MTKIYFNLNGNSENQLTEQLNLICDTIDDLKRKVATSDIFHGRNSMSKEHHREMLKFKGSIIEKLNEMEINFLSYMSVENYEYD